jgi:hypothetical protein
MLDEIRSSDPDMLQRMLEKTESTITDKRKEFDTLGEERKALLQEFQERSSKQAESQEALARELQALGEIRIQVRARLRELGLLLEE